MSHPYEDPPIYMPVPPRTKRMVAITGEADSGRTDLAFVASPTHNRESERIAMPVGLTSDGSQVVGGSDFEPIPVSSSVSTLKSGRPHPPDKAELRALLDDQTAAYVSPPVSPHLTEIETIELGGRTLKLGRNGKFYLVEETGKGPFNEPHYAVFDTEVLIQATGTGPASLLLGQLIQDLIQALGAAIVERNGLAKKAGNS